MKLELIKRILISFFCFIVPWSMVPAEAQIQSQSWPSRLALDGDVLAGGNVGDILLEVGVSLSEPWTTKKYLSGVAYLTVDNNAQVISSEYTDKGVFSVSSDNSVGNAINGSINVCVKTTSNCKGHSGKDWDKNQLGISATDWASVPQSLIRVDSPTSVSLSGDNTWVSLTGKVVLVRLKEGPISVSTITLPSVRLDFNSQLLGGIVDTKSTNILSTTVTDVEGHRACNIQVSGTTITFDPIRSNTPASMTPLDSANSLVNVQCQGSTTQNTLVTLSVTSVSGTVLGDLSSIPLTYVYNGQQNNELVVKATMSDSFPSCFMAAVVDPGSESYDVSKWLDVTGSRNYKIITIPSATKTADETRFVRWALCRRADGSGKLPVGQYKGSAILSITIN